MAEDGKKSLLGSTLQTLDNFMRGAANGVTFGAADYIAGAMDTLTHGGSLKDNVTAELKKTEEAGMTAVAGTAVGSLMLGVGVGKNALEAEGITYKRYRDLKLESATAPGFEDRIYAAEKLEGMVRAAPLMASTGTAAGAFSGLAAGAVSCPGQDLIADELGTKAIINCKNTGTGNTQKGTLASKPVKLGF